MFNHTVTKKKTLVLTDSGIYLSYEEHILRLLDIMRKPFIIIG